MILYYTTAFVVILYYCHGQHYSYQPQYPYNISTIPCALWLASIFLSINKGKTFLKNIFATKNIPKNIPKNIFWNVLYKISYIKRYIVCFNNVKSGHLLFPHLTYFPLEILTTRGQIRAIIQQFFFLFTTKNLVSYYKLFNCSFERVHWLIDTKFGKRGRKFKNIKYIKSSIISRHISKITFKIINHKYCP